MPKNKLKKYLIGVSAGTGIGMLTTAILIFLMAAVLAAADIPAELISPVTVVFLVAGGLASGFSSARLSEEKGLFCGMISGFLFFIIVWFIGMFFENSGFGVSALLKISMIVISSSLGGIFGVNYRRK